MIDSKKRLETYEQLFFQVLSHIKSILPIFHPIPHIFLKNEVNLTANQLEKKEQISLSKLSTRSFKALNIHEAFQNIYTTPTDESFEKLPKEWYFWATYSRLKPMITVAKTIKNHWEGILRWKKSQINNGILKGLNSVVQAAKRKARGYKYKHYKTMVYLITSDLDFNRLNPACLPT